MTGLAGTGTLLRLNMRRDRVKLPVWVLSISVMFLYFASAIQLAYPDATALQNATAMVENPAGTMMTGPGYGMDDPTIENFVANQYGLYLMIAAAFMNVLLVSRHTRLEEETGRSELVRASIVGPYAPLSAALLLALIANLAVTVLGTLGLLAAGFAAVDTFAFALGVGLVGMVFAGITSVTVQLSEYARGATGLASLIIGVSFLIRGVGDVLEKNGSLLSWFSPLAWSQQIRAFVDLRWWPLALSIALTAVAVAIGYALSTRRDVGAGMLPQRLGNAEAPESLSTSFGLTWRLQRGQIMGWGIAFLITGLFYGGLTETIAGAMDDLPPEMLAMMGGDAGALIDGYLGVMALFMAIVAAAYVIVAFTRLRHEETAGRAEPVLATAASRWSWMGSGVAVSAIGATVLMLCAGVGTGLTAWTVTGESSYVADVIGAHLAFLPAVFVSLAFAALLFGFAPKLMQLAWIVPLLSFFVDMIGPALDLPVWLVNLSALSHVPQIPAQAFEFQPLAVLALVAAAAAVIGLATFRRRDLTSV